jgi:rhodanese-related sulfurtransferase
MQQTIQVPRRVDPATVKQLLDNQVPIVLVEALPEPYFQKKHLPGAINAPHDISDDFLFKALPDKEAQTIVYCASGPCPNSGILAHRLIQLGYQNVSDFHSGKAGWEEAGYEFVGN